MNMKWASLAHAEMISLFDLETAFPPVHLLLHVFGAFTPARKCSQDWGQGTFRPEWSGGPGFFPNAGFGNNVRFRAQPRA
jgi:hypothetical protein